MLNENICVALKVTNKETIRVSGRSVKVNSSDLCEIYQTCAEENNDRVVYLTSKRFVASQKARINKVLLYVSPSVAYLVDVVKVGTSWPEQVLKVPDGYTLPGILEGKTSVCWLALEGQWVSVDPKEYVLDAQPEATVAEIFSGNSAQAYVHKV